jgi:hypothetical protein
MAYTTPWSVSAPVTGDAANQLWQFIQNLRQDMQDRLVDKFFQNMTDDPLKFSTAFLGKVGYGDEEFVLNAGSLIQDQGSAPGSFSSNNYQAAIPTNASGYTGLIPVTGFPLGRSLTRVRLLLSIGSGAVTAYLYKTQLNFSGPSVTSTLLWTSAATSGTGIKLIDSGVGAPFPITYADTSPFESLYIKFTQTGSSYFLGGSISHSANSF